MNANYELVIVGGVVALIGKIIWDWLSKTRNLTNEHNYVEEHYKLMGQVETELRKQGHATSNLRQAVEIIGNQMQVLGHQAQEIREDIKELRSQKP